VAKARTFGDPKRFKKDVDRGHIQISFSDYYEIDEVHWKANPEEKDGLGSLIQRLIDIHPQRKDLIQRLIFE
jgi:hypothetical protein